MHGTGDISTRAWSRNECTYKHQRPAWCACERLALGMAACHTCLRLLAEKRFADKAGHLHECCRDRTYAATTTTISCSIERCHGSTGASCLPGEKGRQTRIGYAMTRRFVIAVNHRIQQTSRHRHTKRTSSEYDTHMAHCKLM